MRLQRFIKSITHTVSKEYSTKSRLSNVAIRERRCELFGREKARQLSLVDRVEKIQVEYQGVPDDSCTLLMNKNLSTPYNCAMHMKQLLVEQSVVALVDGQPWDMHRPLTRDCKLSFVHFKSKDPFLANQTFWRSCSFILGHILETAFKDDYYVELCSFPPPDVKSGSFVYDAKLNLEDWTPSKRELTMMSRIGSKLRGEELMCEHLEVDASIAQDMFAHNRFKLSQIPLMASRSPTGNTVTIYRLGSHVDITKGPLISSTKFINRYTVAAIHDINSPEFGPLQRVQGVALPAQLPVHYWAYDQLVERATKKNSAPVPRLVDRNKKEETRALPS